MRDRKDMDDGDVFVCRCEEITRNDVVNAICEGYHTVNDIRKRTRAGMGFCQGKTCGRIIQKMINEYTDIPEYKIMFGRVRPPVRPIQSVTFAQGYDDIL